MGPRTVSLALAIALAFPLAAWACSYGGPPMVSSVLGFGAPDATDVLPANAAGFVDVGPISESVFDLFSEFSPVEGLSLFRIRADLTAVPVAGTDVPVAAAADTSPPARPEIDDARLEVTDGSGDCQSDCNDTLARYVIDVTASDDIAPADRLTYLVYLRRSSVLGGPSMQAVTTADPFLEGALWLWGDPSDQGGERWVWVRAVDQAGNVSELSEPFPVDTGSDGACASAGTASPRTGLVLPLLFALLALRRRVKPHPSSASRLAGGHDRAFEGHTPERDREPERAADPRHQNTGDESR